MVVPRARAVSALVRSFPFLSAAVLPSIPFPAAHSQEQFPAVGVELRSHLPLSAFDDPPASQGNDIWGYVSPSGREYVLMGLNTQTAFVDITDSVAPVILGAVIHTSTTWSDMATYAQHAYVVTDGSGRGMQIVDLTEIDEGLIVERDIYDGGPGFRLVLAHSLTINEASGYAYLAGSRSPGFEGLGILSLADPENPARVGNWNQGYLHDVHVVTYDEGPYAGREIAFCFAGGGGIHVVDVTDKANITPLAMSVVYPGLSYCHQGWLTDDRRYLLVDDEFDEQRPGSTSTTYVFNVSVLEAPVYVGSFTNGQVSTDHNLWVKGNFAFEANYTSGLRIFDISGITDTEAAGVEVAYLDTFEGAGADFIGAWGVFAGFPSGLVAVSDMANGLFVVDPVGARSPLFSAGAESAFAALDHAHGAAWGDVDADGDFDLFVTRLGEGARLYRNDGDPSGFVDITPQPLATGGDGRGPLFFDFDEDGDFDLHLVHSDSSHPDVLVRNDGGSFADAQLFPTDDVGNGRGCAAADYDLDGDLDLFVSQFAQASQLWRNDGGLAFVDVAPAVGLASEESSCGATWADLDGDGHSDLLVSGLFTPNRLYLNTGSGFIDARDALPGGDRGGALSVTAGDLDNDGDLDVVFGGYGAPTVVYRNEGAATFTDVTVEAALGLDTARVFGVSLADVDHDAWLDLLVADYDAGVRLFRNHGDGSFLEETGRNFPDSGTATAATLADADGNGTLDLFVARANGPARFYRNRSDDGHWAEIRLRSERGNRHGIGARVTVEANGTTQTREITAGHGYLSQSPPVASFGLGVATRLDRVFVAWPSGEVTEVLDAPADRSMEIVEALTPIDPGEGNGAPLAVSKSHLYPAIPNPFQPRTTIAFDARGRENVRLVVYDPAGRAVRTLWSGFAEGRHDVTWDGRDDQRRALPSGVYFIRLATGSGNETRVVTLAR